MEEKNKSSNVVDLTPKPKNKTQALEFMKSIQSLSELLPRARLMSRLGQQYDGDRDIYEALGYDLDLKYDDYAAKYERQDIATAIIDRPVDATWRGGVKLIETYDEKESTFEKAWTDLYKRFKLNIMFPRIDKLTGIGKYGVLLLGLDDVKKQEDWKNPVAAGSRKLMYLKPLTENSAEIKTYVDSTANERYGLPLTYNIKITNPGTTSSKQILVHHTRVIHITDKLLESEVEGVPRLRAVYNRLMDLEKLVGGSAEMFWRGARPGYQAIVDKEAGGVDTASLQDTFDEWEHKLRRILINMGVEYKAMEQQIADPSNQVDVIITMISVVTGIPKRVLMGTERGELASSQDDNMWNDLLLARREGVCEYSIVRPFANRLIDYKILPQPRNGYSLKWKDLWSPSVQEKAQIGRTRAISLANYDRAFGSHKHVPPNAFFKYFLGLDDDEMEWLKAVKETYRKEQEAEQAKIEELEEEINEEVDEDGKPTNNII